MNKGALIVVVIAILVVGGVYLLVNNSKTQSPVPSSEDTLQSVPSSSETAQNESTNAASGDTTGAVKEITVTGSPFKFEPSTITVKKGDTVKLTFKNSSGTHNFVIDELNVKTKTISAGESDPVTFTASTAGSFEYYCAVGNHRAMGMKGTLTVE